MYIVLDLASKGRLYTENKGILFLVYDLTSLPSSKTMHNTGRVAHILGDDPLCIYVPPLVLPWTMKAYHWNTPCFLGVTRKLQIYGRFHWWVGLGISVCWWPRHCLKGQARKL